MEKDKKSKKGTRQQAKREEKPPSRTKNQKKKIEGSDDESSDNEEAQTVMPIQKKKPVSIFAMLADDDGDDKTSESEDSEPEPIVQKKPVVQVNQKNSKKQQPTKAGKKNQKEEEDFDAVLAEFSEKPVKTAAADKKGKKNKKGAQDVDEIFENLKLQDDLQNGTSEQPAHPQEQKKAPEIRADMTADELAQIYEQMNMENEEDDDDGKRKKKGNKQQQQKKSEKETPKSGDEESDEDDCEDGSTVKSAAQKKKEKKERQKAEKLLKAQQAKTKPPTEKTKKEGTTASQEPPKKTDVQSAAKPEVEVDEDIQPSKKDKKKKKGDAKEEEKTKKSNKMVSKILEAQRLLKEEEERKRKEEEEKMRKEEEEQRLREEKERLEREKKERKKQKEKERIKRLKAEGKFLTEKQKEDRKRAQQMIKIYKAQGIEVPLPTDKIEASVVPEEVPQEKQKRVIYTRKAKAKAQQQTSSVTSSVTTPTETEQKPLVPEAAKEEKLESEEDVKDNWDDSSDSDDDSQASGAQETTDDVHQKCPKNQAPNASDSSDDDDDEEEEDEDDDGDDDDDDSSSEDEDDEKTPQERAKEKALAAIEKRKAAAEAAKSADKLRAPVICVLGHVDTGKTKILDKLRRSHVQDGEAGGITQQIGATNVPHSSLKEQIKMCKEIDLKIPGLLIIDTPGHESFSNLRTRGSSLCDIAILVVDIMHGLEPQTIESINILKQKKTPFIVALNKIDRLFGWVTNCHADIVNQLKKQKPNTKMEFDERAKHIIVQFAEQGLNARLFYENTKPREFISLVPTSATTGDGVGNLMALICELTQTMMLKRIMLSEELQATVMEVKAIAGHGTTIDVILVNGKLAVGNTIVVAGQEGPIVTQIRSLLLPPPMHEIRVKSNFESHKEVLAAQGCKIAAKDLEKAIAGLPLYVAHSPEEVEIYREELSQMLKDVLSDIKVSEKGVYVQASTLGSLESLLSFLKSSKIPFSGINIGPVHKRDVMKTMAMLEHDPLFACILAFDVKVEKDAQEMAESNNIQIFQADIIYHLFDNFTAFRKRYYQQKQEEFKHIAMFPCKVRIMPEHIFNSRDPIICGVVVEAGFVKEGTILCVPSKNFIDIGRVSSLEVNHKQVEKATKGMEVCLKIDPIPGDAPKMVGRHFEVTDELVSKISRNSIDAVKNWFRDDMDRADWQLIVELKKIFGII